ncbi:MAG: hypothetical protein ABI306_05940 [Caulobacteraceae bacterium]
MSAISPAVALSQFLSTSAPSVPSGGALIDQLGAALLPAGETGMSYREAMAGSGLSRPEFLSAIGPATSGGSIEVFDAGGEQRLRLTPAGRSLY